MALWKNRPLFSCACIFMLSSLIGFFLPSIAKLLLMTLGIICILAIGIMVVRKRRQSKSVYSLMLAIFMLLCMTVSIFSSYVTFDKQKERLSPYIEGNKKVLIIATVIQENGTSSSFSSYTLNIDQVDGLSFSCNAYLTCHYAADLSSGDKISLCSSLLPAKEATGDMYAPYQLIKNDILFGLISQEDGDISLHGNSTTLSLVMNNHRKQAAAHLNVHLGKDAAGIPSAILLGEKHLLDAAVKRDFSRAGVSHLLAISGLHMTVLFGCLAWLLKRMYIMPKIRAVILGIGAFAYLVYLGFPASATRAVIMLGLTYLATLCSCRADPATSLGVAGMGILLFSPNAVSDIGFWLSFSSALGIIALMPLFKKQASSPSDAKGRIKQKLFSILMGLGAGVAALSLSLWILAPVMGEISLFSVPMTLLLTPLMGLLLFCTPLYLCLLSTPLEPLLRAVIHALVAGMENICQHISDLPYAVVAVKSTGVYIIALAMVASTLILLGLSLRGKRKLLILLPLLVGWISVFGLVSVDRINRKDILDVDIITPSTVTEMMIFSQGQEAVICDFSNGSGTAFRAAVNQMSENGVTEISALILTHYHKATAGNLLWLLKSEMVRSLWLPTPQNQEEEYILLSYQEKAQLTHTPVFIYNYEDTLTLFDSAHLHVFRCAIRRSVQPVLLTTLSTPTQSVTYCGGGVLESALSQRATEAVAQSTAVFFGHHGPKLKEPLMCTFSENLQHIGFADENILSLLSPQHQPSIPCVQGSLSFSLNLKD